MRDDKGWIPLPLGIETVEDYKQFISSSPENAAYMADYLSGKNTAKKRLEPKVASGDGCVYACFHVGYMYVKIRFPSLSLQKSLMIAQTCVSLRGVAIIECCSSLLRKNGEYLPVRKKDGSPDVILVNSQGTTIPVFEWGILRLFFKDSVELSVSEAHELINSWQKKNWHVGQEVSRVETKVVRPEKFWPSKRLSIEELSMSLPDCLSDINGETVEGSEFYPQKALLRIPQEKSRGHNGYVPKTPTTPSSIEYLRKKLLPSEEMLTEKTEGGVKFEIRTQRLERCQVWEGTAYIRTGKFASIKRPNLKSKRPVYRIIWEE